MTSSSFSNMGDLEAQIRSLEAQLAQKDEIIQDLGGKMNKNLSDYADLVSFEYSKTRVLIWY